MPQLAANNILGDELHTGSGGVAQYAGGSNFAIIIENAEHTLHVRARNQRQKLMWAVLELRGLLFAWYETAAGREYAHDQMRDIQLKDLVGSDIRHPCIDAKAMQSRMLFMFSAWVLEK